MVRTEKTISKSYFQKKLELEDSCVQKKYNIPILFWTSEIYGIGKIFRQMGFYPRNWPLNIYNSHGIQLSDAPRKSELENKAPAMFYFTKRLTKSFNSYGLKPCFTVISPNAFYRRKNRVQANIDAQGTIVFPGHSTPMIDVVLDIDGYLNKLESLPKTFYPFTICLHQHDIDKGTHIEYLKRGFEVVTAGNVLDPSYIEKFYNILKRFKYSTSNQIGSYTFYAVEMDTPFFLFGDHPELHNRGNKNMELGLYESFRKDETRKKATELFQNISTEVGQEQKEFAEEQLGIYDSISRIKLASILYYTYYLYQKNKIRTKFKNTLKKLYISLKPNRN